MSTTLTEIDRETLHGKLNRGDELVLVDALGPFRSRRRTYPAP